MNLKKFCGLPRIIILTIFAPQMIGLVFLLLLPRAAGAQTCESVQILYEEVCEALGGVGVESSKCPFMEEPIFGGPICCCFEAKQESQQNQTDSASGKKPIYFKPQVTIPGSEMFKAYQECAKEQGCDCDDADQSCQESCLNECGILMSKNRGTLLAKYIQAWYKFAVAGVGILAVVVIMGGGIIWITAGGNAGQIDIAKKWIWDAAIGLVIALMSYTLLDILNPNLLTFKSLDIPDVEGLVMCCSAKDGPFYIDPENKTGEKTDTCEGENQQGKKGKVCPNNKCIYSKISKIYKCSESFCFASYKDKDSCESDFQCSWGVVEHYCVPKTECKTKDECPNNLRCIYGKCVTCIASGQPCTDPIFGNDDCCSNDCLDSYPPSIKYLCK